MIEVPKWLALVVSLGGIPAVILVGRTWLTSLIEGHVKVGVERRTELIRAEIRQSEERLKSDLRTKESQIASLRDGVLSGRAARVAAVEKRRLEAVDRLWLAVTQLSRMKGLAMTASMFKFDAVAERVPNDQNLRDFFEKLTDTFGGQNFIDRVAEIKTDEERPYLSEYAWALYSAYSAVIYSGYTYLKILSIGIDNSDKFIDKSHVGKLLKSALPHQASYIDEHGNNGYYYLLEEIENKILLEIRNDLSGLEADEDNIRRSADILRAVAEVNKESEKLATAVAETL